MILRQCQATQKDNKDERGWWEKGCEGMGQGVSDHARYGGGYLGHSQR